MGMWASSKDRMVEYVDSSIALNETLMLEVVQMQMRSWNRYFTVLTTTLLVFFLAVLYRTDPITFLNISIEVRHAAAVILLFFFYWNIHAWKILKALRTTFRRAEKKRLFQFMLSLEPGIFNPFTSKRNGILAALPFGSIYALGIIVFIYYILSFDIISAFEQILLTLNRIAAEWIGAGEGIFDGNAVGGLKFDAENSGDTQFASILISSLGLILAVISFFVFHLSLVRSMNLILGFGSWAKHSDIGSRFQISVFLLTIVAVVTIIALFGEERIYSQRLL